MAEEEVVDTAEVEEEVSLTIHTEVKKSDPPFFQTLLHYLYPFRSLIQNSFTDTFSIPFFFNRIRWRRRLRRRRRGLRRWRRIRRRRRSQYVQLTLEHRLQSIELTQIIASSQCPTSEDLFVLKTGIPLRSSSSRRTSTRKTSAFKLVPNVKSPSTVERRRFKSSATTSPNQSPISTR